MIEPGIEGFLTQTVIPLRLSCVDRAGWPVVLSLWFVYDQGRLLCATPASAKVVAHLRAEPRCAFEIAGDLPPYCGVRGRATATIDPDRGWAVLERLLVRYLGGTDNKLAQRLLARNVDEVALILTPSTLHTWNYTPRMADLAGAEPSKPCPPG